MRTTSIALPPAIATSRARAASRRRTRLASTARLKPWPRMSRSSLTPSRLLARALVPGVAPSLCGLPPLASRPGQPLPTKLLTERLRVFRLGKAEHYEVTAIALHEVCQLRRWQPFRNAIHQLGVLKAAHFVGWQRHMVGPSATEVGTGDLTLASRHRRRAINQAAGISRSLATLWIASRSSLASTVPSQMALCATRKTSKVDSNGGSGFFTMLVVLAGIHVGSNRSATRRSPGVARRKGPGHLPEPGAGRCQETGAACGGEETPILHASHKTRSQLWRSPIGAAALPGLALTTNQA
jgi:hypothetical protein